MVVEVVSRSKVKRHRGEKQCVKSVSLEPQAVYSFWRMDCPVDPDGVFFRGEAEFVGGMEIWKHFKQGGRVGPVEIFMLESSVWLCY